MYSFEVCGKMDNLTCWNFYIRPDIRPVINLFIIYPHIAAAKCDNEI